MFDNEQQSRGRQQIAHLGGATARPMGLRNVTKLGLSPSVRAKRANTTAPAGRKMIARGKHSEASAAPGTGAPTIISLSPSEGEPAQRAALVLFHLRVGVRGPLAPSMNSLPVIAGVGDEGLFKAIQSYSRLSLPFRRRNSAQRNKKHYIFGARPRIQGRAGRCAIAL